MNLSETVRHWASRLQHAAAAARERNLLRTELADLAARGELDRALTEVGLTRAQLPILVKNFPDACHLLARMMGRLGIDAETVERVGSMHEVVWRCTACAARRRCAAWLDHPDDKGWRSFCPNVETFEEALARRGCTGAGVGARPAC